MAWVELKSEEASPGLFGPQLSKSPNDDLESGVEWGCFTKHINRARCTPARRCRESSRSSRDGLTCQHINTQVGNTQAINEYTNMTGGSLLDPEPSGVFLSSPVPVTTTGSKQSLSGGGSWPCEVHISPVQTVIDLSLTTSLSFAAVNLYRRDPRSVSSQAVFKAILGQIQMLERQQESLDRKLTANMLQINCIGKEILQAITVITPDPDFQEELDEDDKLPGSDWTLNSQEQSQELIPRQEWRARKAAWQSESLEDPYIPSLESQIETAIVGDRSVVGKPPGVDVNIYYN
ncbi:hypothetical protein C8J57DRAFT_1253353 [Mycena rebaudengoi]|nr:hypothetical protein C8J57DRAFT_1253353 [Mycena rebaudengoi]